ncbi:MAG: FAD-dependent oxidoreductase [Patescibacteria group bacterium]
MKIAILGGGITGLVCAEVLSRSGINEITIYESEENCGGLASGFRADHWGWSLERAYHHIFSCDEDILGYAKEIGYDKFYFQSPITSSLYKYKDKYILHPLDTPIDLLRFPLINIFQRLQAGFALFLLKISPHLPIFETLSTEKLMSLLMGKKAYSTLFGGLMQKKFGKYAVNIRSVFIWARVTKRTKKLGYVQNGFQSFVDYLKDECEKKGVQIKLKAGVKSVSMVEDGLLEVEDNTSAKAKYDYVVSTLPSPVASKVMKNVLDSTEIDNLENLKYLASMNVIIETKEKYFDKEYWVSNCVEDIPALVFVQHTNFVDSRYYDGKNILYVGNYLSEDNPLWTKSKQELLELYEGILEKITGKKLEILSSFLFKAKFSQPIFDEGFVKRLPKVETSNNRLFFANLDMTYPYDRGTNYAVRLGKKAAAALIKTIDKNTERRL